MERRLIEQYAELPPADVSVIVGRARAELENSRVRDFMPLFVEKRAKRELAYVEILAKPIQRVVGTITAGPGSVNPVVSFESS